MHPEKMKSKTQFWAVLAHLAFVLSFLLGLNSQFSALYAQGTTFTYQGRLAEGGSLATGHYDLRFGIYDAATGNNEVAGPLTNSAIAVNNGLFTVTLDFGPGVFTGDGRWS